jgi:TRAP-type C4-dicarboxylate transport system permease small subunit
MPGPAFLRIYDGIYGLLGAMTAILIAAMALMISADVIMRNAGLGTIPWAIELAEYMQLTAVFLGAPWVLRLGAHVRVDLILHAVPLYTARALDILANAAGIGISGALFWFAGVVGINAYRDGARVIKSFIFPEWWIFALVAFSATLLLIEFVRRLWSGPTEPAASSI